MSDQRVSSYTIGIPPKRFLRVTHVRDSFYAGQRRFSAQDDRSIIIVSTKLATSHRNRAPPQNLALRTRPTIKID
ncbi:hypothetical protein G6F37_006341 [Rhizopus arrhizus]|nr:hypothetical protein G6F38_007021 [Rhizopus arrhizus]KAG1157843.1 hypothetical protein G6F37_006341 [Rhizopus arrhizus]